ncbi:MAG TPA: hypothetical protein VLA52_10960 [Thermohalobaculum sp.]|nr:hypothetical protein [Thermohalobaculum sp.]
MAKSASLARLHVLLAREAAAAVVIRRGPAKAVGIFGWNRETGEITPGQWLRGRIYERRCDLSPDGRHLIYFAMNGKWQDPVSKGSWTAISRAPWLKAVTFYPWGDCWVGGGLFLDNRRYWLNGGGGPGPMGWESPDLVRDETFRPEGYGNNECLGVYFPRLMRDGWERLNYDPAHPRPGLHETVEFRKPLAGGWMLWKAARAGGAPRGRAIYWDTHMLEGPGGELLDRPQWDWADRDGDCLLYAEGGCLWRQGIGAAGSLAEPVLIHDFNPDRFAAVEAPY